MNKKLDDIDVICPNCGDRHSHILKIDIYPSDEDSMEGDKGYLSTIEITHYGKIELKPYEEVRARSRGLGYRTSFICEDCYCLWSEKNLFHKGSTFRTLEVDALLTFDEYCASLDNEKPPWQRATS